MKQSSPPVESKKIKQSRLCPLARTYKPGSCTAPECKTQCFSGAFFFEGYHTSGVVTRQSVKIYNRINRGIERLCFSLSRLNFNLMSFIDPKSKAVRINICAAFFLCSIPLRSGGCNPEQAGAMQINRVSINEYVFKRI